jgi:cyclic pyranopterin phosphate synthase
MIKSHDAPDGGFQTDMPHDRFGRRIHYLRVSLTDHCNMRCVYCMPEDQTFMPRKELMQDDEILTLISVAAELGFDKIRLTGGEPTARAGVVDLVAGITATPGVKSLSMTTTGALLTRFAEPLARAGLQRVNISLDTLDPQRFELLTRRGSLQDVWAGIEAAQAAGLEPIKLNVVIVRGYNERDVADIAALTRDRPWQVRFIEMMPFAGATKLQTQGVVSHEETKALIESDLGRLEEVNGARLDGEARIYRIPGAEGTIGLISSVTQPFCASCTRARLTADGRLRLCLLREKEVDLLSPLRSGESREQIHQRIMDAIWNKPWGHGLDQEEIPLNRAMNQIGG